MPPKAGEWYCGEGGRVHKVIAVAGDVVRYADVYQRRGVARYAAVRESSLIQWETDVAAGRLRRVARCPGDGGGE